MTLRRRFAIVLLLLGVAVRVAAAELTLAIEPRWRGDSLSVPSVNISNNAAQNLRITRIAILLSEVELLRTDGGTVRLEGQYGFMDAERGRLSWTLRNVPEGAFVGLGFRVGVPPEINHRDPGSWAAGHALNPLVNGLHWSWQGGYVFFALEGRWSAPAGSAEKERERGFSYHLATDAHVMNVRFLANFEVKGGTVVKLALDLARVLGAQQIATEDGSDSTHSAAGDELAVKLAAAAERAWFWLGAGRVVPDAPFSGDAHASEARVRDRAADLRAIPFAFTVPAGFPPPALPADNALTVEGIALGAALFSDARLSGNGTQSCASCHAPERAFSDAVALSVGATGAFGQRNAMPLTNLAWSPSFAWDGSQPRIRDQALAAWTNPIEMHGEPAAVVASLARDEKLAAQFTAAFGRGGITAGRITLALEQYLLTQISADSKFDRARRGETQLSDDEKRGFELFMTEYDPARGRRGADCFHCHGGALFTDFGFKDNGLDRTATDRGRALATGKSADAGKFKTPSLRNVALTAPYMHDGRFATLEDVLAHYDHGVQRSANLDPNLAKHPDSGLQLSAAEQRALVAFLRTLTDARFAGDHASPSQ